MRKTLIVFTLMLLVTINVTARPVTRTVYEAETYGVCLTTDTDSYGKDFKFSDNAMGELKFHKNYFVWNVNKKQFESGSAKGMDLWMNTFGDLFKYADDLVKDGYSYAGLVFITDGFNADDMIKGIFVVTNSGIIYGYWDY